MPELPSSSPWPMLKLQRCHYRSASRSTISFTNSHRTNGATTHSPTPFRTGAATPATPGPPTSLPTLAQALSSSPPATDLPPPSQPASAAAMPSHPSDEESQSCIGEPEHSILKLPDLSQWPAQSLVGAVMTLLPL